MSPRPRRGLSESIRRKLIGALTPAALGAGLGFVYARQTLSPELMESSALPAMYATMGAALGILAVRVVSLGRLMFADFFGSDQGEK